MGYTIYNQTKNWYNNNLEFGQWDMWVYISSLPTIGHHFTSES